MHPYKSAEVEPSSPSLTLSCVPSCSSGSPLFPDCLFFKVNYANTSRPGIHGNHISSIPQPVFWQKRPIQVTTQTRTNGRKASPRVESPGPSVSVCTDPYSQPFCVAGAGFLFLKPGDSVIPVSLITGNGLCPITVRQPPQWAGGSIWCYHSAHMYS